MTVVTYLERKEDMTIIRVPTHKPDSFVSPQDGTPARAKGETGEFTDSYGNQASARRLTSSDTATRIRRWFAKNFGA